MSISTRGLYQQSLPQRHKRSISSSSKINMPPSPPSSDDTPGRRRQWQWARSADWDVHRARITELYRDRGLHLDQVIETMANEYGFYASPRMYKTRISKWAIDKNYKAADVACMLLLKRQRASQGKASSFVLRGRPVDWAKIEQYLKRDSTLLRRLEAGDDLLDLVPGHAQTSGIICRTPSPTPSPLPTAQARAHAQAQAAAKVLPSQSSAQFLPGTAAAASLDRRGHHGSGMAASAVSPTNHMGPGSGPLHPQLAATGSIQMPMPLPMNLSMPMTMMPGPGQGRPHSHSFDSASLSMTGTPLHHQHGHSVAYAAYPRHHTIAVPAMPVPMSMYPFQSTYTAPLQPHHPPQHQHQHPHQYQHQYHQQQHQHQQQERTQVQPQPQPSRHVSVALPPYMPASPEVGLADELVQLTRDYCRGAFETGVWVRSGGGPGCFTSARAGQAGGRRLQAWGQRMRRARQLIGAGQLDEGFRGVGACMDELRQHVHDEDPALLYHLLGNTVGHTPHFRALAATLCGHIRDLAHIVLGAAHPLSRMFDRLDAVATSNAHFAALPAPLRCLMEMFAAEERGGEANSASASSSGDLEADALCDRFALLLRRSQHSTASPLLLPAETFMSPPPSSSLSASPPPSSSTSSPRSSGSPTAAADTDGPSLLQIVDTLERSQNMHVRLRFYHTYVVYLSELALASTSAITNGTASHYGSTSNSNSLSALLAYSPSEISTAASAAIAMAAASHNHGGGSGVGNEGLLPPPSAWPMSTSTSATTTTAIADTNVPSSSSSTPITVATTTRASSASSASSASPGHSSTCATPDSTYTTTTGIAGATLVGTTNSAAHNNHLVSTTAHLRDPRQFYVFGVDAVDPANYHHHHHHQPVASATPRAMLAVEGVDHQHHYLQQQQQLGHYSHQPSSRPPSSSAATSAAALAPMDHMDLSDMHSAGLLDVNSSGGEGRNASNDGPAMGQVSLSKELEDIVNMEWV